MKQLSAAGRRHERALWVAGEVLPHEQKVRAWLRRARVSPEDIDEILQEAYCRIATLESVAHITSPYSYFLSTARNLLARRLRRQRIVPMEALVQVDSYQDDAPSPEELAVSKVSHRAMLALIDRLPERCGSIVRLRKLEGWSQKKIADHLGTTEKAVEKQVWLGVRLLREAWSRAEGDADERLVRSSSVMGVRQWWK
ncbi:RNA polymerase sigma-70 factor (ECF subfamily) [Sphingomonas insulae]|uniref:RNA polymerase subunit sigma-24 n=1 Tax=Sphingomonas insulae TaxID=424800 RepID=A0ABN1HP96_9SPHN|nr:sigma-70 family RNA polymerase sigma factor [Sphingomonas insulae]NIJ30726.1 RNA polymerase sigma-70 factor (ECF subfamily) [Sphingomonas insulae]